MKNLMFIVTIMAGLLFVTPSFSQITKLDNAATNFTEYVGWNGAVNTTPKDLDIQNHFGNKNIVLWTNDGTSPLVRASLQRGLLRVC